MLFEVTPEEGTLYFPDWKDNRDLDNDDPEKIFVYLLPLTKKIENRLQRQLAARLDKKSGKRLKPSEVSKAQTEMQRDTFIQCVKKMGGFKIKDAAGAIVEPDLGWIYDNGPSELVEDILQAIQSDSQLDEGKKKD